MASGLLSFSRRVLPGLSAFADATVLGSKGLLLNAVPAKACEERHSQPRDYESTAAATWLSSKEKGH